MSQSRLHSFVETSVNMLVGFWLSVAVQMVVFPLYGYDLKLHDNMAIVAIFTLVSMARGYCLRRVFNWWSIKHAEYAERNRP